MTRKSAILGLFLAATGAACSGTSSAPVGDADSGGGVGTGTGDGGGTTADPDGGTTAADAATGPFALTSPSLAEGATFDKMFTCNATPNKNAMVSPPFAWTAGPATTKSYAIVMNDLTIRFLHGVTCDIPATIREAPRGVDRKYQPAAPAGAKQTRAYDNEFGYAGPCPPNGEDTYEFTLYALDVETLPGMTMNSSRSAAETEIKKHVVATAKLTGKYKQ